MVLPLSSDSLSITPIIYYASRDIAPLPVLLAANAIRRGCREVRTWRLPSGRHWRHDL